MRVAPPRSLPTERPMSGSKREGGRSGSPRTFPDVGAWVAAARPRTLGASLVPVLVGLAYAGRSVTIDLHIALLTAAAALALQIASNLANDYYDFAAGIDTGQRLGPTRASAAGLLAPESVRRAALLCIGVALVAGVVLVAHGGWPILGVGVASAAFALAYSGGPLPLASLGLGEVLAFVFFGLVAVSGTAFLQRVPVSGELLLVAMPVGALVAAIMAVNNLRDIPTDATTGKRTLAVRLGERGARTFHTLLVALAFALLPCVAWLVAPTALLPLAVAPLAIAEARAVWRRNGSELNQSLAGTARLHLVFGAAYVLGLSA